MLIKLEKPQSLFLAKESDKLWGQNVATFIGEQKC